MNASVVVVESLAQVTAKAAEIKDKILVFNQAWNDSASSLEVVSKGAIEAAKVGAVGTAVAKPSRFCVLTSLQLVLSDLLLLSLWPPCMLLAPTMHLVSSKFPSPVSLSKTPNIWPLCTRTLVYVLSCPLSDHRILM